MQNQNLQNANTLGEIAKQAGYTKQWLEYLARKREDFPPVLAIVGGVRVFDERLVLQYVGRKEEQ